MLNSILASIDTAAIEAINQEFASSKEHAVQHYRSWGGGGYFDVPRSVGRVWNAYGMITPSAGARILDIGPGFGFFAYVARFTGKHEVVCADVVTGHSGGEGESPECEAMLVKVNQVLGNTRVTMKPIRAGVPVEFNTSIGKFDLITLDGTVFDRGWTADDYAYLFRSLRRWLQPKGRIWARSNTSPFKVDAAKAANQGQTVVVTAGTESYRPILLRVLQHAKLLGMGAAVYDLGGLGIGECWSVQNQNFLREGCYWRSEDGWPTKAMHKPKILLDLLAKWGDSPAQFVYLDADAVPVAPLELPYNDFDIAVTLRPDSERKVEGHKYHTFLGSVNAGVLFFKTSARPFIEEWARRTAQAKNDQFALNSLLGDNRLKAGDSLEVEGVKVRCLGPGWNRTFAAKDSPVEITTRVVHFKSQSWAKYAAFPSASGIVLPEYDRRELVRRLPKNGVGVEVGVLQGRFSEQLMQGTSPTMLHLVDAWAPVAGNYDQSRAGGKEDHGVNYRETLKRMQRYVDATRARIHIGFTSTVLPTFPDSYFDWAYLDANHAYEGVKEDLELIRPKMKPDGVIAGHDYDATSTWAKDIRCGVVQAVTDFCQTYGWRLKWVFADAYRNPSFLLTRLG